LWNYNYFAAQHSLAWHSYFDFYRFINISYSAKENNILNLWINESKNCHWWFPLENFVIASERHNILRINTNGQLHCDNGPALAYPDGFCLYSLNGINLTKEQFTISNPKDVLKEQNIDIRRELIKRMGIERMLGGLNHKILEKNGNYELLSIELSSEIRDARYLKMLNPSIQTFHIEGVGPNCKTIAEAINWRQEHIFGEKDWNPSQLS